MKRISFFQALERHKNQLKAKWKSIAQGAVQKTVEETTKTNSELAVEVILGLHGNGDQRKAEQSLDLHSKMSLK